MAYSDHTPGWDMDVAARAMGADLLEKTITLDRCQKSPEHMFSLEPEDMGRFVHVIRDLETAMGSPVRVIGKAEEKMRKTLRRSAFLKAAVKEGEAVVPGVIEYRRPGTGIGPDLFEVFFGKKFSRDLAAGTCLAPEDFF